MKTITIRGVELGSGTPKVAVPIVGKTQAEILAKAVEIRESAIDLAEWRADCYCDAARQDKVLETLRGLRAELGKLPLLFTLRTRHDGGMIELDDDAYLLLNETAANSGCADLVDVEIFRSPKLVREHITALKRNVVVIGSFHDFCATPSCGSMVSLLCREMELGADISKIAVMPQNQSDVLALLEASLDMRLRHPEQLLVTVSMGQLGTLSRIACEMTGSCITFGAMGRVSAPGQIQAVELKNMLTSIHEAQKESDD